MGGVTIIARALELAEGSASLEEVRVKLLREGYFGVAPRLRHRHVKPKILARLRDHNSDSEIERQSA